MKRNATRPEFPRNYSRKKYNLKTPSIDCGFCKRVTGVVENSKAEQKQKKQSEATNFIDDVNSLDVIVII